MLRRYVCVVAVLLAIGIVPARGEDFWGRMLPDQPVNFIFGYGSLINSASRNATSDHPIAAIPVRVSAAFGYIRGWDDRSPSGFTALGLRKPEPGESAMTINGVLYPVEGNDMAAFDARERGYIRVEVPRADIEAVSWQGLPADGRIWVYVPDIAGREAGTGLPLPDAKFPMLESYIDVVIQGGLEYGREFAREIIVTTKDWSPYWLNDRDLARRPWVFDKQSAVVDKLLSGFAPHFADRVFSEECAAKYLLGRNAGAVSPAR
ncbi:MAG TPA: gamma-glutamylcyclotransferase family protein [Acetobacteraceae bacterium]